MARVSVQGEAVLEALNPRVITSCKQPITLVHWICLVRNESLFGGREKRRDHLVVIVITAMVL